MPRNLPILIAAALSMATVAFTSAQDDSFERLYRDAAVGHFQSQRRMAAQIVKLQRETHRRYDDQILQVTKDLIAFKTVAEDGKTTTDMPEFVQIRSYLRTLSAKLGFSYRTYFNDQIMEISVGSGPETLAFYTHADVMPAGGGWDADLDPWVARERDGRLYGRGSIDDKGPTASILFAMKELKDHKGIPANRRVALVITTQEELGQWDEIKTFSDERRYKWNLVADSVYPAKIAEKGILLGWLQLPLTASAEHQTHPYRITALKAGLKHNQLADAAEALVSVVGGQPDQLSLAADRYNADHPGAHVTVVPDGNGPIRVGAKGKAAHASTPDLGRNATTDLVAFLNSLDLEPDAYSAFLRAVSAAFLAKDGSSLGIAVSDDKQFTPPGTTVVNSILTEESGFLKASFDIRYHPKISEKQVLDAIEKKVVVIDPRFKVTVKMAQAPFFNDPDDELVRRLVGIHNVEAGTPGLAPISNGGGTQTRVLAGEHRMVFGPREPDNNSLHGPNEYISIENLRLNTSIYLRAMMDILRGS